MVRGGRRLTTVATETCENCGTGDVRVHLGDAPLCDRCTDRRGARLTGLPELGAPPPPSVLAGPDGSSHRMRPRPWRAPTGIVVELKEMGVPLGEGFAFSILGPHDAEVDDLLRQLRAHAEAEVALTGPPDSGPPVVGVQSPA